MTSQLTVDSIVGRATAANVKMPAGSVLQTVTHQWKSAHTQTSTSFSDVTGSSFSFTPKYATSKLLLSYFTEENVYAAATSDYAGGHLRFMIDAASQADYTSGHNYQIYIEATSATTINNHMRQSKCIVVDATNTTARTIKLQVCTYGGQTTRFAVNYGDAYVSTIVAQEISV